MLARSFEFSWLTCCHFEPPVSLLPSARPAVCWARLAGQPDPSPPLDPWVDDADVTAASPEPPPAPPQEPLVAEALPGAEAAASAGGAAATSAAAKRFAAAEAARLDAERVSLPIFKLPFFLKNKIK